MELVHDGARTLVRGDFDSDSFSPVEPDHESGESAEEWSEQFQKEASEIRWKRDWDVCGT